MKKPTIILSLLAAAALAACGGAQTRTPMAYSTPADTTQARSGFGKVASDLVDPNGPVDGISMQRMTLTMQDGSTQMIDRRGHQVAVGERIWVK
jgi:hypothetical protein